MSKNNFAEENKKFALKTLSMLSPILNKKQFQLVNLELDHKSQKISDEIFNEQKLILSQSIFNLEKRILREMLILESVDPKK